ncbi:hypothetical protein Tco_0433091 [Tanacetum coccineum]
MSTSNQQTLADLGANERPPMLEKGNYIPWESRFKRFMDNKLEDGERMLIFGSDVTSHVRHSRVIDEFDKFAAKEGESLESVYERLTTLMNIMDRNNVRLISVSINTKFLNCLQPEWSKYVTMVRHNQTGGTISYDVLYDSLVQIKPHVLASIAKNVAKNHDPLALLAHSNASSSQSHANSSYSPQPYYVIHPSSVVDYEDEYQWELQGDSQEDKLTTAMMLLARAITQKFSTPTNNRLRTSSNTRNQAMVQYGRVDIQTKNAGYGGNGNRNARRQNRNQSFNVGNGNNDSNQIKPRVRDAKYFREQMLLAMKDEPESNIRDEENDFLLDNSYGEEKMEELTVVVMLMARIQPADGNTETVPSYDAKAVSEVNALSKVHKQVSHVKCKTIIQTYDDDQIDSNIIFDDPYVENNGGTSEHDSNTYDEYHEIQINQDVVQDGRVDIQTKNAGYGGNGNRNAARQNRNQAFNERNGNDDGIQIVQPNGNAKTVPSYDAKPVSEVNASSKVHEQLERELRADKDTIEIILKETDKIQSDFFKIENEKVLIQHETQLAKKAFKERENRYLEEIVDLEEKLSIYDRIVYKISQSIQIIHMLGKPPNKVYDPFLKAGLGYKNPERLKKAIAAQPKMYDGERLHSAKLTTDSPNSDETLEDAEESRLKMRNKMVQINYGKLNALYETFVPQHEFSVEQTYFSIPFTYDNGSESKEVTSDLPILKIPKES